MPLNDSSGLLHQPVGLSLAWSFHLTDALHRCGVRHAFISPGSRSTPLTMALTHHPGFTCHSVLDERSAAFMALGAGKRSGVPALFVCTSGTAVANALPAVVEARMSAAPLIVLSADRPPNMRAIGASQTIDQTKIFGDYLLFSFDTGEPVNTNADFTRLGRLAYQAYTHAASDGGPVHLNLPFRKPLEPTREQITCCVSQYVGSVENHPDSASGDLYPPFTPPVTLSGDLQSVPRIMQKMIAAAKRPLVIAGPVSRFYHTSDTTDIKKESKKSSSAGSLSEIHPESAFFDWCRRSHIPILAETGGIPGGITRHPLLLRNKADAESLKPDLILRIGGSPVHQSTLNALQTWQAPQIIFREHRDYHDATLSATHEVAGFARNYDWESFRSFKSSFEAYFDEWQLRDAQLATEQRYRLDNEPEFADGHVYAHLLPLLRSGSDAQIILSNSFAIRDYPLFAPDEDASRFPVLVNRGASGIDGVTSTAIGAALVNGNPTILITGDLAFLHDITALNNLSSRQLSLKIVVINNHGGTIFRMLPFDNHDEVYREYIETPQKVSISDLAGAHGIKCETVNAADDLEKAWNRLAEHPIGILECRTNADASMRLRSSL